MSEQCDHNVMLVGPPAKCADCGYRYGVDDKDNKPATQPAST